MTAELNLSNVHPSLQEQARDAIDEGDGKGFVACAKSNDVALELVVDNFMLLKERGIYEVCLLAAFIGCRVNHRHWSEEWLDLIFGRADPTKLRAAGDPLPGPGPFCLYRGVAGRGRARRLRGYSWTSSLDTACWFAARLWLPSPAVLRMTVQAKNVLAYSNGRTEQEFICKPLRFDRLTLSSDEISQKAKLRTEAVKMAKETKLAQLPDDKLASDDSIQKHARIIHL